MEEKNFENKVPVQYSGGRGDGFVRKYLKTVVTVLLLTAILITSGVYVIDKKVSIESKQSSYKLTTFDYVITAPNTSQVEEFSKNAAVNKLFPCYSFSPLAANGGATFALLMCDSLENYEISLFNEDTCISGKADASGIMLDETAAKKLNVKVGDDVNFALGGVPVSLKVSGIYMASTYNGLSKGLGLAVFTEQMKSYFDKTISYNLAFIDAKDTAGCAAMLKGYIPYGEFISEADYIEKQKNNMPEKEEEYAAWETAIKQDYLEELGKFESKPHPNAVQAKSVYMKDVMDQIETRESDVTYISVILGIASFVAYAAFGILFIYMNKRDDEISLMEGVPHSKMLREYMLTNTVGALFVTVVTGVVLIFAAMGMHYLVPCLPIVLVSALPILPSAAIVAIFARAHLVKMYRVHIGRGGDNIG